MFIVSLLLPRRRAITKKKKKIITFTILARSLSLHVMKTRTVKLTMYTSDRWNSKNITCIIPLHTLRSYFHSQYRAHLPKFASIVSPEGEKNKKNCDAISTVRHIGKHDMNNISREECNFSKSVYKEILYYIARILDTFFSSLYPRQMSF